ncbi:arylalkylamine N-acetyltransferase 1-like [Euwallacea fornicatus]|uniref:arylalkylamine N-acetyltransferase 1-like n=1 Tax=Euwallacea fornicatus TaxID=995702 RepID=UPI00338E1186
MSLTFGPSIFKIISVSMRCNTNQHTHKTRCFSLFCGKQNIKDASPYLIMRANKDDFDEVLKVMHEGYFDGEPIVNALGISPNLIMDERVRYAMAEGYTLVAKCKYNGRIVGACINKSTRTWDPDLEEELACKIESESMRKLLMFYAHIMRVPDLWRYLEVQKIYEMAYVFVKRPYRKRGLAYRLLDKSKALGVDASFPVVRCDATNMYTARICSRLGMQKIAEIPYSTYLDQNFNSIFKPPWSNESVKIFCDCSPQCRRLKKKIDEKSKSC